MFKGVLRSSFHINGKTLKSYKISTSTVLEWVPKIIEIHGMKGVSVWPILLDDRSNVANNFKKTLAQVTPHSLFLHAHA
jgi:hypothetical protein